MTDRKLQIGIVQQTEAPGLIGIDAAVIEGDPIVVLTSVDGGLLVKPSDIGEPMSASIMFTPEAAAQLNELVGEAIARSRQMLGNPHLGEPIDPDHNT